MNDVTKDVQFDLNLLRIVHAIDGEGSVTGAAQSLGLSQPAVSSALGRLRRALNDPLFVRSKDGMEATPRARRLLGAIDGALGLIRQGLRDEGTFDPATATATFELLLSDVGELVLLPSLVSCVQERAPGCALKVRQLARGGYAEALEAGAADVAVGFIVAPRAGLRTRRLFSDHFVCMVRAGHPAARMPLTIDAYLALSHVAVSRRGGREGLVATTVAGLGGARRVVLSLPHFAGAAGAVATSDLAATVPSRLVAAYAPLGLTGLKLPFPIPDVRLSLYWHDRMQDDPAHRWLRQVFVRLFAKGGAS